MRYSTGCLLALGIAVSACGGGGGGSGGEAISPPRYSGDEIEKLLAIDSDSDDIFGHAIAIDGDYAIVGAPFEDGGAGDPLFAAGAAYIYRRTGPDTWDDGIKLVATDAGANDEFGSSVGIAGDYAVVGAPNWDIVNNPNAGAAYVFRRIGPNAWDAGTRLVAPDASNFTGDQFGHAVAISGDTLIVGAWLKDGGTPAAPVNSAGAAYLFERTGANAWDAGTRIVAPDAQADDRFGESVMIDGDYAIVGASNEDGGPGDPQPQAGAAYVYLRTGPATWDAGTRLVAADAQAGDRFGFSVGIDGDIAIVGAFLENGGAGDPLLQAGAAYAYQRTGVTTWDGGIKLIPPGLQPVDWFGFSVAVRDDYAVVGARLADVDDGGPLRGDAGSASLFRLVGGSDWRFVTRVVAGDAQIEGHFGHAVAIGRDTVAASAVHQDGQGIFQVDAGAAYLFR